MVYAKNNTQLSHTLYETLEKASQRMGIRVEEPYFIELDKENDMNQLNQKLEHFMIGTGKFYHPSMVMCLL